MLNQGDWIEVREFEMLLVSTKEGQALLDFVTTSRNDAEYRWRYWDIASGRESRGRGRVFEKFRYARNRDDLVLVDLGSDLLIEVGPIEFEWQIAGFIQEVAEPSRRETYRLRADAKLVTESTINRVGLVAGPVRLLKLPDEQFNNLLLPRM